MINQTSYDWIHARVGDILGPWGQYEVSHHTRAWSIEPPTTTVFHWLVLSWGGALAHS